MTSLPQESFQKERSKLQAHLGDARKVLEELETDKAMMVAEVKQQMHLAMESKDQELDGVRTSCHQLRTENEQLEAKVSQLEHTGQSGLYLNSSGVNVKGTQHAA